MEQADTQDNEKDNKQNTKIMKKKKIIILLPCLAWSPVGGFKVVYEYANRLVAVGHEVTIVYPLICHYTQVTFLKKLKSLLTNIILFIFRGCHFYSWFPLDERITNKVVWSLYKKNLLLGDLYIATAVSTAYYLHAYKPLNRDIKKFYFIQDHEIFTMPETKVNEAYNFPDLQKIVIADWLRDKVEQMGSTATVIPNGFNFSQFFKFKDFSKRNKYLVTMMYHHMERKGCKDAIEALHEVKQIIPELQVYMFGVSEAPAHLPEWFTYFRHPDKETHNRIYNESSIFIAASHEEGWGLTVGEAMMCGTAVACTDNGGFKMMCTDGKNALLSPIKNPHALAINIIKLINNDDLRLRIAQAGYESIQSFTWDNSFFRFYSMMKLDKP
ncbi:glycosyltransferase [Parabacteroides sp. AF18-52]|jgi:glycosyltransferase, group 1 family protein|uniref:glycosyltransferase family 4 protein n=1 Tax=Parabacteroides sp. AF18-52 TaxID=2292242 RepID=UPI000EFF330D|nr:glycosyltransferase family 4 protein [Parabacteroides sp. AF18-52]RHR40030.1 glycosyltransferase [Parabacteroides sp. AF18-52]